ncbi:MAG TPA: hypothetical protein VFS39_03415 [Nitrospira sp.]|nr:hypothetical protein [Nitrospira sp.]
MVKKDNASDATKCQHETEMKPMVLLRWVTQKSRMSSFISEAHPDNTATIQEYDASACLIVVPL